MCVCVWGGACIGVSHPRVDGADLIEGHIEFLDVVLHMANALAPLESQIHTHDVAQDVDNTPKIT